MNKKVLTLCAGLVLAGSANVWAEKIGTDVAVTTGYQLQYGLFSAYGAVSVDDNSAVDDSNFPTVSPFQIIKANGAKPIYELENVNGKADSRYFQFVVSDAENEASTAKKGTEVLTMVFVKNGDNAQGHYELQVENVNNANIKSNRIILDRTLWKVTAEKDPAGTTLYYTLQNKATDAILQLSTSNVIDTYMDGNDKIQEVNLNIVAGQTDWRWAKGEKAAASSTSDNDATNPVVLKDQLTAQYSNGTTMYLVRKKVTSGSSTTTLAAIIMNSTKTFNSAITVGNVTFEPLTFEGWEANPIILTADQINSELGAETLNGGSSNNKFKFTFDPDVQGDTNIMLGSDFTAEGPKDGGDRLAGDAPDGFVRFKSANGGYLHVDTAYYDSSLNGRYYLKMNVGDITFSRYAVAADDATVNGDGNIVDENGDVLKLSDVLATTTTVPNTAKTYAQMMRQSNFRPIFYPSTQSLRLQAEMIYKAKKADLANGQSWWMQMAADASWSTSSDQTTGTPGGGNYMRIALAANDPTISLEGNAEAARGYYPSYAFDETVGGYKGVRLIHYDDAAAPGANLKYLATGTDDVDNTNGAQMAWNAVGNLFAKVAIVGNENNTNKNALVSDPAQASGATKNIYSSVYATAQSNVVRLATLTPTHIVLTTDMHDVNNTNTIYNGLLTFISMDGLRGTSQLSPVANIEEAFYYIQNENRNSTQVAGVGDYRYEDLAATNAMFAYWNTRTEKWDRGVSNLNGLGAQDTDYNATKDNANINEDMHKADNANIGNLVYSEEKLIIPSAQWYIKGNGDHYTLINRESGRQWNTEYWWGTNDPEVFVNQATFTNAAGQETTYLDTIRITKVPAAELNNPYLGYLNLSQEECQNDTTVYNIGMENFGGNRFSLSVVDGVLTMTADSTGAYKLERALVEDIDPYVTSNKSHYTDELVYGFVRPDANKAGEVDTMQMLKRAKYYIYKDEVSANSGIEKESITTRKYVTLSEGKYRLQDVKVQFNTVEDDADNTLYSFNLEVEEIPGTENVKYRRAFYIKQITPNANQYVLVDPEVVATVDNNTGDATYGARVFVNQLTGELQPGSLVSGGYANSYASSILNVEPVGKQNYADIRGGEDRMNAKFFVEGDNTWLLGENGAVKGSNVGLLELRKQDADICNSIFVDTANVHDAAFPRFLLAVRNVDSVEVSNIPNHNHHILTKGAYLVNMIDSAATNNVYKYVNRDFNNTEWYRLGFVNATHQGDSLAIDGTTTTFDLSTEGLDKTGGLNYATFAFRYVDTERDNFYIETAYKGTTKGWVKIHNGVAVVTPDIQEAEVFSFETTDEYATANETIAAEGAVSVVATDGAVIVKGAEGKNVVIATILGKVVANETINSDNETIAVPAGIAVVSVDGESFKVVVK